MRVLEILCLSVLQLFYHTKSPWDGLEIFVNPKTIYPETFLIHLYLTLSL